MIELDEIDSTNSFLKTYQPLRPVNLILVTAEFQSAGRGQIGNSWEAAKGKNLLFSLLFSPAQLLAQDMFVLSEAIALSVRQAIADALTEHGVCAEVSVKWPNDIYVGQKKIAGILIENDLMGRQIGHSIIGCGVNINQESFVSDAPNPVSVRQLVGVEVERRFVLEDIIEHFTHWCELIKRGDYESLHQAYMSVLFRREGFHQYRDSNGRNFMAEIAAVKRSGHLLLRDSEGQMRTYAFKEVEYVLD